MADETLEDLAAEVAQEEIDNMEFEGDEPDDLGDGPEEYREPDPKMAKVFATCFLAVGNVICARAKVSPISEGEAKAVGDAGAEVMAFYDFQPSGEAGVWLGLGMAIAAVSVPRLQEARAVIDQEASEPEQRPLDTQPEVKDNW